MSSTFTPKQAAELREKLERTFNAIKQSPWDVNAIINHIGLLSYVVDSMLEQIEQEGMDNDQTN